MPTVKLAMSPFVNPLFQDAVSFSPTGKIPFIVANAGIHSTDEVFYYDGGGKAPEMTDLATIDVNLTGRYILRTSLLMT